MSGRSLLKTLMPLDNGGYVPALRWRLAESQALFRLEESVKDNIVPLITIPPIEFDFETGTLKKTVHEHVHPFVARYMKKWRWRPSWVALDESIARGRMNGGEHVFDYVLDRLRPRGGLVIPVLDLAADTRTKAAVAQAVEWDQHVVGVIVRLEDLMRDDVGIGVLGLVDEVGGSPHEADVLIDMASPSYEPYEQFTNALVSAFGKLGDTVAFRSLVLIGTAIPESFALVAKGSDEIPRHDWLFDRGPDRTPRRAFYRLACPARVRMLPNHRHPLSSVRSPARYRHGRLHRPPAPEAGPFIHLRRTNDPGT